MDDFYGEVISGKAAALVLGMNDKNLGDLVRKGHIERVAHGKYCIESVFKEALKRKISKQEAPKQQQKARQNHINIHHISLHGREMTIEFNTDQALEKFLNFLSESNIYMMNRATDEKHIKGLDSEVFDFSEQLLHLSYYESAING